MLRLSRTLVLASNSPRRQQLMKEAGFSFEVEVRPTPETYPAALPASEVAGYLAAQKAAEFRRGTEDRLVLCADTVVISQGAILNKPAGPDEARTMLRQFSGATHRVVTGVALLDYEQVHTVADEARVTFRPLQDSEIEYYIQHYQPFDKAGAYGIQEWIGMVGVERIEGSFYTIMGLPVHRVYDLLRPYRLPINLTP